MSRSLATRLARLEAVRRQVGTVLLTATDEADAERVRREHGASGDPRDLLVVITGVPRNPDQEP